jgi:sugar O-acyltransferase (sialic acid O-acetyltransferase NeuD family)
MTQFIILEVDDPLWSDAVKHSREHDFYHTQSYHLLEKEHRPVLCVLTFGADFIAMPFIIRPIPNSIYFDSTSVYGYSGPISNLEFNSIEPDKIIQFKKELLLFFKENNIIAVFSRLHPLIDNNFIFHDFGIVNEANKTVAIDLRLSVEEQLAQYRKSNKYEINQLRKNGFEVVETKSKEAIDAFIAIYYESMNRLEASKEFYYDAEYFHSFFDNKCFNAKLLVAKKEGEIIAGAIFTITNKIMQYHLAGTAEKYNKLAPMKLILDEARLLGNTLNLDFLHLGGGVSSSEEDSLFRFKTGFSHDKYQFKTWQLVVDQSKYDDLVLENKTELGSEFFPLYRSNTSNTVTLYGASGHGKVIIDILNLRNIPIELIVDDNPQVSSLSNVPVVADATFTKRDNLIITIGDNLVRKKISKKINANYIKVFHPQTIISPYAIIGKGSVVLAGVIINSYSKIGVQSIINTRALIEHDCIIGDFVHISPLASLAGNVTVGEGTQIGIGAIVIQGIKIGKWCVIGAGAVIIRDVPDYAVVVGNPGRIIRYQDKNLYK